MDFFFPLLLGLFFSSYAAIYAKHVGLDANITKFKNYLSEIDSFLSLLSDSKSKDPTSGNDDNPSATQFIRLCSFPAIIRCKKSGNITYREDSLGLARKCIFSSWKLTTNEGSLKITLLYLSMNASKDQTYLAAFEGGSSSSPLLFKALAGDSVFMNSYESISSEIFIQLYANKYPTGWRFSILYETWNHEEEQTSSESQLPVDDKMLRNDYALNRDSKHNNDITNGCYGKPAILTSESGTIHSPNFDLAKGYPDKSNCSWLIAVDPGNTIKLEFESFSIAPAFPHTSMCFDALRIYEGHAVDVKLLRRTHCGNDLPPDFQSTTNQAFINFQADEQKNNFKGFSIHYSTIEGSSISGKNFSCGVPKIHPNIYNRIVGGVQAKPHSWPWQITLQYFGQHVCGACLIHPSWVLTAAHCLIDVENHSDILVRLGEHNLAVPEGNEETRQIDYSIAHPSYNSNTNDFDVVLLHLNSEVTFNDYVSPVCLPNDHENYDDLVCVVAGWGTTKDASYNVILNQLTVPFIETSTCNDKGWYNGKVTVNMFCAGYKEGRRDSCQGDSGGPLVCSDGQHWSVFGIISWGFDCAQPKHPGVYTNITVMRSWIHAVIKNVQVGIY